MKVSTTSQYGLIAVGYVASHSEQGNIMGQTIAQEYNIPLEYLLKILQQLVRAGILNSKRGPRGGFTMGRALDKITLLDVFEAIDGPSLRFDIFEGDKKEEFASRMEKVCEKALMERNQILASVTLAELVRA